jgi:dihydroxy-acid dehydratase
MLYAVGFTREDFGKSQIGIASPSAGVTPCNMHLDRLAAKVELGVNADGGKALRFNTITISDGIAMGTRGMFFTQNF